MQPPFAGGLLMTQQQQQLQMGMAPTPPMPGGYHPGGYHPGAHQQQQMGVAAPMPPPMPGGYPYVIGGGGEKTVYSHHQTRFRSTYGLTEGNTCFLLVVNGLIKLNG